MSPRPVAHFVTKPSVGLSAWKMSPEKDNVDLAGDSSSVIEEVNSLTRIRALPESVVLIHESKRCHGVRAP